MVTDHSQLIKVRENIRILEKLTKELEKVEQEQTALTLQENKYYKKLLEEKVDVEKLEGFSIAGVFTTLIGKKEEKLTKEKREVLEAQLQYQEAKQAKAETDQELQQVKEKIAVLGDPKLEYDQLLKAKQRELLAKPSQIGEELLVLNDTIADLKADKREIEEAYTAGRQANDALSRALTSLEKAKNWGTVDMFGGGLISTSIKHSNMDDARAEVHRAQSLLKKFTRELEDIGQQFQADLSISGGLTFMDYFFDGIISDWFVQDKIHNSIEQVEDIFRQTTRTMSQLQKLLTEINDTLIKANHKWEKYMLTN